ncbi:hypothetical protein ACTXT7_008474, partial [Hymenolepis weldensis]
RRGDKLSELVDTFYERVEEKVGMRFKYHNETSDRIALSLGKELMETASGHTLGEEEGLAAKDEK